MLGHYTLAYIFVPLAAAPKQESYLSSRVTAQLNAVFSGIKKTDQDTSLCLTRKLL
ncbi:hypothetical protein SAMN03159453_00617 [Pseudomonas sp. NFIX28]|nr:hypothetical protein SAMN03159453_00617 [Pseudomonas sp. NFIX28]